MPLAIFDLDNTLLAGDSDHSWGQYLVEEGIVNADEYKKANDQFLRDYENGDLDIIQYLSFALQPLTKHPLSTLHDWREHFIETKIKPIMLKKGIALVEQHRQAGDILMIITATNRFITEPIAKAFGIDILIATEPEFVNDEYTGRVSGTPSFQEGKIKRLNEWLVSNQQKLENAFFYSDSHNDLPLLKIVDNPVAIDPDEKLAEYCLANNWPIRSLRD